jgi:hypothetical protein
MSELKKKNIMAVARLQNARLAVVQALYEFGLSVSDFMKICERDQKMSNPRTLYCSDIDESIEAEFEFNDDGVTVKIPAQTVQAGKWARDYLMALDGEEE